MKIKKHKWVTEGRIFPFDHCNCLVCGERSDCPADPCDSDGITRWRDKLLKRTDCPGHKSKPSKSKFKVKDIYIDPSNSWYS